MCLSYDSSYSSSVSRLVRPSPGRICSSAENKRLAEVKVSVEEAFISLKKNMADKQ